MTFRVIGLPTSQGSMKAVPYRGRRVGRRSAVIHTKGAEIARWRKTVAVHARAAHLPMLTGPVQVTLTFYLPGGHLDAFDQPTERPVKGGDFDLDKLTRAVYDALKKIAWVDDRQVVWELASKHYAGRHAGILQPPGVAVSIQPSDVVP